MQDRAVLIVIVCCMGTVGRHRLTQPGHPSGLSKLSTSSSWAVNRPTLWHVKHYSRLWPCSVSLCVVECCENGDQHCSMDPYGSGRVFFHMTTSVVYMEDFALAVVSRTRRFQVGCAHLPMAAWSGSTISFSLYPAHPWTPPGMGKGGGTLPPRNVEKFFLHKWCLELQ